MTLKKRTLGKTGLLVTEIGFGGIPIQRVSEEKAVEVVKRCYDLGINYFDTARGYTTSEERIGKALEGVREEVIIATKSHSKTARELRDNLETSLRKLRTDYIDLYQFHNLSEESWKYVCAPGGVLEELLKIKEEDVVKHIGVTSHSPKLLTQLVGEGSPFETIMIPYNYLSTDPSKELLPLSNRMNIGTIIMKPFGGGAFSNARTALKFVLSDPNANCTIPGMNTIEEVEENVSVCGGDLTITDEERILIQRDKELLGDQFCAACEYCQPCPAGISISFVLRTEISGLRRMGWSEGTLRQTADMANKVAACLQCGTCETRCPYRLPIRQLLPEKIKRLQKLAESRTIPTSY